MAAPPLKEDDKGRDKNMDIDMDLDMMNVDKDDIGNNNDDTLNNNNNGNNNHNSNNNGNSNNTSAPEDAIDDSEDLPDDFVELQKTRSSERRRRLSKTHGVQDLLPFPFSPLIRPLAISDLESCFVYRLTACPELCMGVYCTVVPSKAEGWEIDTLSTAHPVETGRDDGAVSVLLAHIIATRSHDRIVTDESMDYPRDYQETRANGSNKNKSRLGHQETGRTICIHSLAVHPKLQGVGVGKLILISYLQQIMSSALADRVALICKDYLVSYYTRFGFSHLGPSEAKFSGGGWHDMALLTPPSPIVPPPPVDYYGGPTPELC
ncbi:hypothetical protein F4777DRAFT_573975 [Nemania sp. FL0916]|nr:hypothetical protein F4777DRAFT_573975 [Nemania sp. FL0916]